MCDDSPFLVVIAASAEGNPSLRSLVRGLKATGRAAILVAQLPSTSDELDAWAASDGERMAQMATDGARIEVDHCYIVPPGQTASVAAGRIRLVSDGTLPETESPLDTLFASVAEAYGPHAVAVMLAGSGITIGPGCTAVKGHGGTVLAEATPGLTEVDPIDLHGTIEQITSWLNDLGTLGIAGRSLPAADDPDVFNEILAICSDASGLDLSRYKEGTLRRQILKRSQLLGVATLAGYLERLRDDPLELSELHQQFLISVSAFFRDPEVFAALERSLRALIGTKRPGDSIRVWVPACASGEEPYSIAILIGELLGSRLSKFDVRVFASDVDEEALETARAGVYRAVDLSGLEAGLVARWFTAEGAMWRVDKTLREMCVFSVHDLIRHPPFIRMDLISCRNLLIYIKGEQHESLLATFHYALNPQGLLLLGKSESTGFNSRLFDAVSSECKLYRRRSGSALHPARFARSIPLPAGRPRRAFGPSAQVLRQTLVEATHVLLANDYAPASILVNADFEPIHFFGDARRYLVLPDADAEFSVFALCLPPLRSELKGLCYRFAQEGGESTLTGYPVAVTLEDRTLRIRPVLRRVQAGEGGDCAILISFEEEAVADADAFSVTEPRIDSCQAEIARLQRELADTREQLHSVIEQLEASNGELQSLNEELQSSSEELQTSNEELQSSNEELSTLNDELRAKSVQFNELSTTLGNIQNSVRMGLVVVDRDKRITRYNALAVRIFGLVAQDVGQLLTSVPCHLDIPNLREQIDTVIASQQSRVERLHQAGFHFLLRIDPYFDEAGHCGGAVLTFGDISELFLAESAQKASEHRFRCVWEASQEGLLVVDTSGTIELVNPALERMFGYAPGELLGQPIEILVPDALRTAHCGKRDDFMRQPNAIRQLGLMRDLRGRRKDGTEFFAEIGLTRLQMEGKPYVLASAVDSSERRQAEDALRESEERFRSFMDNSLVVAWLKDAGGRYVYTNRQFAERFSEHEADWIGKTDHDVWPAQYARLYHYDDEQLLQSGSAIQRTQITPSRHNGEAHWLQSKFVYRDTSGKAYVGGMGMEITEKVRIERELERHREHLEELVNRRTSELVAAKAAAESASRAKSAFLANMSHEIRTPMNAVLGLTHLLLRGDPNADQQEKLSKILDASQHLLTIINDVLDFSKIEAGKLSLEESDFNLERIIERVMALVADKCRDKRLELLADIAPELAPWPILRGDPTRLTQALLNYLSNAVKFTARGRIQLTVRIEQETASDFLLRFEVEDTGCGIQAEHLGRLFEAFEQADSSTTRTYGGTGLGLAINRRLAELMHGRVGVDSRAGAGSRFWLEARIGKSHAQPDRAPLLAIQSKAVLIVTADAMLGRTLSGQVRRLGPAVTLVDTVEAAANVIGEHRFDWVLIDRWVDDDALNSPTRLRQVLPGEWYRETRFALVDYDQPQAQEYRLAGGYDTVLYKPVLPSVLAERLAGSAERVQVSDLATRDGSRRSDDESMLQQTRRGRSVLLAEDNPVNQIVAAELLEAAGLSVDIADNGRDAVAKAAQQRYDLVLMDVQMPEMDGIDATRALRRLPGYAGVPILAMTAGAFDEDRRRCLDAGMNDHIAKPVDPRAMYAALLRWLPPSDPPAGATAADPRAWAARLAYLPGVNFNRGLDQVQGSLPVYRRLLGLFNQHHRDDALMIRVAVEAGDGAKARLVAHSLKGAAVTLGLVRIGELATLLENRFRNAPPPTLAEVGEAIQKLMAAMQPVIEAIDAIGPEQQEAG